ncbi:hypothetical protein [Embleya sp. AB8]|uniref:hypothetical protein n=1 Tax=Embleya sp. AB8 TaxID=3156304 RepID=UPI003C710006
MARYPGRPAWTTKVAPAAVAALVLLLAGCGGSSGKSTSASAPSSAPGSAGGGADATTKAYVDCLRANGVTMPTGRPGGGARSSGRPSNRPTRAPGERPTGFPSGRANPRSTDPAFVKAEEACAKLRPTRGPGGGPGGTAGPEHGGNDSAGRAFASCLRDHRVELPAGGASALDRADPKVAEALKVCEALLPAASGTATATETAAPTT